MLEEIKQFIKKEQDSIIHQVEISAAGQTQFDYYAGAGAMCARILKFVETLEKK